MEHLAVVSPQTGELTGQILPRKEVYANKLWCRSTNVFILNHKGDILCHQRALHKEHFPGAWSTHLGGHLAFDETYEENARKELEEEAGIVVEEKDLIPWRLTQHEHSRLWIKEFVTVMELDVATLVPQPGEVEQFAWKSLDEILAHRELYPHLWMAGTHDFVKEYFTMRGVLTAFHEYGAIDLPLTLRNWK